MAGAGGSPGVVRLAAAAHEGGAGAARRRLPPDVIIEQTAEGPRYHARGLALTMPAGGPSRN